MLDPVVDINTVYAVNQVGIKVARIQGRYYKVEFWQEATQTMLKHHLKGRDITEKLVSAPQLAVAGKSDQQLTSMVISFADIPVRTIECSPEVPFILYT